MSSFTTIKDNSRLHIEDLNDFTSITRRGNTQQQHIIDISNKLPYYQSSRITPQQISDESLVQNIKHKFSGKGLWGRPLWFILHLGSIYYPENPNQSDKLMMKSFINGLPIMIPCLECRKHAFDFITSNQININRAISNREFVFKFFVDFHNHVNKMTGKPIMDYNTAINLYNKDPLTALF
jgi:hypothetical protein